MVRSDEVDSHHVGWQQLELQSRKFGKIVLLRVTFLKCHKKGFHYSCEGLMASDTDVRNDRFP